MRSLLGPGALACDCHPLLFRHRFQPALGAGFCLRDAASGLEYRRRDDGQVSVERGSSAAGLCRDGAYRIYALPPLVGISRRCRVSVRSQHHTGVRAAL